VAGLRLRCACRGPLFVALPAAAAGVRGAAAESGGWVGGALLIGQPRAAAGLGPVDAVEILGPAAAAVVPPPPPPCPPPPAPSPAPPPPRLAPTPATPASSVLRNLRLPGSANAATPRAGPGSSAAGACVGEPAAEAEREAGAAAAVAFVAAVGDEAGDGGCGYAGGHGGGGDSGTRMVSAQGGGDSRGSAGRQGRGVPVVGKGRAAGTAVGAASGGEAGWDFLPADVMAGLALRRSIRY
jgi:hypothetical protein